MKIMNSIIFIAGLFLVLTPQFAMAQIAAGQFGFRSNVQEVEEVATSSASTTESTASTTAVNLITQQQISSPANDLTKPEELTKKVAIITSFEARPVTEFGILNAMAYWVQEAVRQGVPANTIFLILLTPLLALLVSFVRVVVGLPTLDMLVPIALSFALVAVGINLGLLVLGAILVASYVAKKSLSGLKIMFYPKRSLSMFFLALSVFAALTIGVALNFDRILSVSIFPILILMLLGDMIVSVQLHKSSFETFVITGTTIMIGLIGYFLATSSTIEETLILYPEIILIVIPLNLIIGRYFGLRFLELFRFNEV